MKKKITIKMSESEKQIWSLLRVALNNGKSINVNFKVDNGCNIVLLSKDVFQDLGFDVSKKGLENRPKESASFGDGSISNLVCLGKITILSPTRELICTVKAYCHSTRLTRNLLGTSVLHQYNEYRIRRGKGSCLDLIKY